MIYNKYKSNIWGIFMGYKFKIEKNQKKYIFVLYPNNSNIQPIGESCDYDSISECSKALSQFRKIIKQTNTEYSTIDSNLVSCVYAANDLKDRLKNPNSLEIISAECYNEGEDTIVKIEYSAENIVGGTKEDDYYCIVNTPTENNGQWYCTLKPIFY